jgi:hypothetical protein
LTRALSLKAHVAKQYLPLGIGAVVILDLLFTYAPPLQECFESEAIVLGTWLDLCSGAACVLPLGGNGFRIAYGLHRAAGLAEPATLN